MLRREPAGCLCMKTDRRMPPSTLEQLQAMLKRTESAERARPPAGKSAPLQIGSPLDQLFPPGGLPRGVLVEWLGQGSGSGATRLALSVACAAQDSGLVLVVIDRQSRFYVPAAAGLGIDPAGLIIVRPARQLDELWALDQAVRCTGVAAVLWRGDTSPGILDVRHFRRLQLACQASGVIGLLIRSHTARQEPSWADVRLLIQPQPSGRTDSVGQSRGGVGVGSGLSAWQSSSFVRRLEVEVLRCRGRRTGARVQLEIDDEIPQIRSADPLPMAARRPAGRRRPA